MNWFFRTNIMFWLLGATIVAQTDSHARERKVALVIGDDRYRYVAQLKTAVNDARTMQAVLRDRFGFETKLLTDASRADIIGALSVYRRTLDPDSSLLIYYAGHGYSDPALGKTYWWPVDAQPNDPAEWISADDITTSIRALAARHILVVSDSCFAGTLSRGVSVPGHFAPGEDRAATLRKLQARLSREIFASGGDEPVADGGAGDHSIFASAFLRALQSMEPSEFAVEEIFAAVRDSVGGRSSQLPQLDPLRNSGHDGGSFIFTRTGTSAAATTRLAPLQKSDAAGEALARIEEPGNPTRAAQLRKPVDRPMTRFSVDLGPDAVRGQRITVVLSPDGTRLVFTGRAEKGLQLFTRRVDQAEAVPLAGTEGVDTSFPFFSPDGKWIGFISGGKIRKVADSGGPAVVVGDAPPINMGAAWGEDGNILVGTPAGLMRIPASGGVAQEVEQGAGPQLFPQVLPGAQAAIYNTSGHNNALDDVDIEAVEFKTGRTKTLLHGGYFPRYLPTSGETGHLVYMHDGTLFGIAFNPTDLEVHGTPTPLLDDIAASSSLDRDGGGQFAFSETGTFVYLGGRVHSDAYPILAMDASGKAAPLLTQTGAYGQPRFSPDGTQLAYTAPGSKGVEVWAYNLERDTSTQLTFTGPGAHELAWSPDSKHLVFTDGAALWWIRADGSGPPQKLLSESARPFSFSPEGRLVYSGNVGGAIPDLRTLPLDLSDPEHPKPGKVALFLSDPHVVNVDPAFSPDGKFLAYTSSELGGEEVFVRPFPGPGGKWKVSAEGGKFPVWSRTAHQLLFLGFNDRIIAADYTIQGDSFSVGKPRVWSPTQIRRTSVAQNFDLAPDGKRVAFFPRPTEGEPKGSLHATFLLNFFDELQRRVPQGR